MPSEWEGRPFEPNEPTIEEMDVDFLMNETFPGWVEVEVAQPFSSLQLPLAEQRRQLATLRRVVWPDKKLP